MVRLDTIKFKTGIGIFLIFALGAMTGSIGTHLYFKNKMARFFVGDPAVRTSIVMKKMSQELGLTEEQKIKIEPILKETHQRVLELREKHRPDVQFIMDTGFSQINEHLTEDQKEKFDRLHKKFHSAHTLPTPIRTHP